MIKKLFTTLFFALSAVATMAQDAYIFTSFREPSTGGLHYLYSYDGLKWDTIPGEWLIPQIGNEEMYTDAFTGELVLPFFAPEDRVFRDPSITQGPDGTFHLVWTMQWYGAKGFGYAHSKDLINWSKQIEVPVMKDHKTNNVWAPEIFYDDELKEYFIIWACMLDPKMRTEADNLGTNNAQRLWYTTTKDFKRFAPAKPYYDPGFNSIDAFLLKRASKDYVLVVKDNRKPGFSNLFCVFSDSPHGPFHMADKAPKGTTPAVTFGKTYSEGPCAVNLGKEWIIYYDQYRPQSFGAVSTKDFKTFTYIPERVSVPLAHKHGTIVKVKREIVENLLKASK